MTQRVERIARKVMGECRGHDRRLSSAGTFDGLRDYAHRIGFVLAKPLSYQVICLAIYSRCVNAEIGIEQVLGRSFSWVFGMGGRVQAAARDICRNIIDYDDLLLHWAQTVNDPTLVEDIDGRFDHVLVDQCQNTNRMTSMRRSVVQQI